MFLVRPSILTSILLAGLQLPGAQGQATASSPERLLAGPPLVLPALESSIEAPVPRADALFGEQIAACDDLLVVGARLDDLFANNGGAVYIYRRTGAGLVYSQTLLPPAMDQQNDLWFGQDVDLTCDAPLQFIAVGFDPPGETGGAYVFERTGLDSWEEVAKLVPPSGLPDEDWGSAIAADAWDDGGWIYRVAIGGPRARVAPTGTPAFVGAVVLYQRKTRFDWEGGTPIHANETIIPGDRAPGDEFGAAVDLRGPWLVVGAPGDDSTTALDVGAVYFLSPGAQRSKLRPAGLGIGARFGTDVSLDLFWVAAAAINDPDALTTNAGAVYLYSIFGAPDLVSPPGPVIPQYTERLLPPPSVSTVTNLDKVVIDTPYLLAGRPDDEASLALFVRTGLDTWGLRGILEPSTPNRLVTGGIAMDGPFLYGGAQFETVMGQTQAGSVIEWDVLELRPIFADGFESGNTSFWSSAVP